MRPAGTFSDIQLSNSRVDDPDLAVAIIVENGGTGSEAAVPIAEQIFDAYYYDK